MKTISAIGLLTLLFACGEPRIKSIDDETLAESQRIKAEAALTNAQTALLGTWQACFADGVSGSIQYSYSFSQDGQSAFQKITYAQPACSDPAGQPHLEKLRLPYRLSPGKDTAFILSFDVSGKRFESEYQINGVDTVLLPKIFELKDQGLPLLGLKETESFVSLTRLPSDAIDQVLDAAEKDLLAYAQTLLKRDGIWMQACTKNQMLSLEVEGTSKLTLTTTQQKFTDSLCKTPTAEAAITVKYQLASITLADLAKKTVLLNLLQDDKTQVEAKVSVSQQTLDLILFNDLPLVFEATP